MIANASPSETQKRHDFGTLAFVYDMSDQPVTVSGTANGIGAANGNYTYDGNLKRVKSVVNGRATAVAFSDFI